MRYTAHLHGCLGPHKIIIAVREDTIITATVITMTEAITCAIKFFIEHSKMRQHR